MTTNLMDGKVCLITGASQGLGRHFASVLANAGATVIVTSLKSEMGQLETLASDNSSYMTGSIIEVDVSFAIDLFLREDFDGDKTNAFFSPR